MPKASVHKDCDLLPDECNVRFSRDVLAVQPTPSQPSRPEHFSNHELRLRVLRLVGAHGTRHSLVHRLRLKATLNFSFGHKNYPQAIRGKMIVSIS